MSPFQAITVNLSSPDALPFHFRKLLDLLLRGAGKPEAVFPLTEAFSTLLKSHLVYLENDPTHENSRHVAQSVLRAFSSSSLINDDGERHFGYSQSPIHLLTKIISPDQIHILSQICGVEMVVKALDPSMASEHMAQIDPDMICGYVRQTVAQLITSGEENRQSSAVWSARSFCNSIYCSGLEPQINAFTSGIAHAVYENGGEEFIRRSLSSTHPQLDRIITLVTEDVGSTAGQVYGKIENMRFALRRSTPPQPNDPKEWQRMPYKFEL